MDYSRRPLADRLAAEYVLGTLRGPARRRFENLLPSHPALRDAVRMWQQRLDTFSASVEPVEPSTQVWTRIQDRLFVAQASSAAATGAGWWQRLGFWRSLSGLATTAALALLVVNQQVPPVAPPIVVVLAANPQAAQATPARFVASLSPDGRSLVLRPIDAPPLTAQQALELWAVPASGAPRSLGLVKADGETKLLRAQLLSNTAAFAVSVEPAGGSPTGAPTGPIVSLGELRI